MLNYVSLFPIQWRRVEEISAEMTPVERSWLLHPGSLTKRLRGASQGDVEHWVHEEEWDLPQTDEAQQLGLSLEETAKIRETDWCFQGSIWVATRAVIPEKTLKNEGTRLHTVGDRSLGDVLFADPNLQRGPFEFAQLAWDHPYLDRLEDYLSMEIEMLWARRSVFHYFAQPLLVSEIFFPSIFSLMPKDD